MKKVALVLVTLLISCSSPTSKEHQKQMKLLYIDFETISTEELYSIYAIDFIDYEIKFHQKHLDGLYEDGEDALFIFDQTYEGEVERHIKSVKNLNQIHKESTKNDKIIVLAHKFKGNNKNYIQLIVKYKNRIIPVKFRLGNSFEMTNTIGVKALYEYADYQTNKEKIQKMHWLIDPEKLLAK